MKVSVLGAGSWGITIAQALADNNHDVVIYDAFFNKRNERRAGGLEYILHIRTP